MQYLPDGNIHFMASAYYDGEKMAEDRAKFSKRPRCLKRKVDPEELGAELRDTHVEVFFSRFLRP